MNQYITGAAIRRLREKKNLTQSALAEQIAVSSKTVSKWENGRGFPDISLIESLAAALGISTIELLSGSYILNENRSANMLRSKWYVCPVCGNIINSTGDAVVSCCGITLPAQEEEEPDEDHQIRFERVEDEWYVYLDHPMERDHYISFLAAECGDEVRFVKLYPEGNAEARFKIYGTRKLVCFCNRHGLFKVRVPVRNQQ